MIETATVDGFSRRELLFVHGRDFKPAAEDLLDLCISATAAGIQRDCPEWLDAFHAAHKTIAYYGDISNEYLTGMGRHFDAAVDLGDRRNALAALRTLSKAKQFGVGRYDRLPGKTAIAEFAADIAAPVLGALGLSGALIAKVAADLHEYWNADSDFGARIRGRVRAAITAALLENRRLMILAHGTGSVATWDVLWQLSHHPDYAPPLSGRKVEQWLTLGSPLGDATVRRRLQGAKSRDRGRFPTNVLSWHNVSAEDDYMCHDNTLGDDFRDMLKQRQVSCIRDYRIYNLAVRYGKSNPHSSVGYLIHPRVSKLVTDWLREGDAPPKLNDIP
jgi:hypothetical protein